MGHIFPIVFVHSSNEHVALLRAAAHRYEYELRPANGACTRCQRTKCADWLQPIFRRGRCHGDVEASRALRTLENRNFHFIHKFDGAKLRTIHNGYDAQASSVKGEHFVRRKPVKWLFQRFYKPFNMHNTSTHRIHFSSIFGIRFLSFILFLFSYLHIFDLISHFCFNFDFVESQPLDSELKNRIYESFLCASASFVDFSRFSLLSLTPSGKIAN